MTQKAAQSIKVGHNDTLKWVTVSWITEQNINKVGHSDTDNSTEH
jgi:hypothetical protein